MGKTEKISKSQNLKKSKKMKFLIIIFGILSSSVKAQSQESACDQLFAQQLKLTPNPCNDRTFAGKCRQKCPETIFEALPRSATELCIDAFSFCGQIKLTQCNLASVKMGCKKTCDACDEDFTAQIQQDEDAGPKCTDQRFCSFFFSALPCNSPAMANSKYLASDESLLMTHFQTEKNTTTIVRLLAEIPIALLQLLLNQQQQNQRKTAAALMP